jgi:predicted cobalt transporter CbtA
MWTAYTVLIHLLAFPAVMFLFGLGVSLMLSLTTNELTGNPRPWARGLGWGMIGFVVGCSAAQILSIFRF